MRGDGCRCAICRFEIKKKKFVHLESDEGEMIFCDEGTRLPLRVIVRVVFH